MLDGQKVLGLITARGGSKGLPGKNIRPLRGKPLIAWSIEAAKSCTSLDALVVSTDSEEIAAVARHYGAEAPFLRPSELAGDTATSVDVIEHAINFLRERGEEYGYVVLIEPTSPLREPHDIDLALRQMSEAGADSVVSVGLADTVHPAFMFRKGAAQRLELFQGGAFRVLRRQELEPVFFLEGTVYASRVASLLAQRTFCQTNTVGYEVPKWKVPEIDDIVDFLHVEAIMKHRGIGS